MTAATKQTTRKTTARAAQTAEKTAKKTADAANQAASDAFAAFETISDTARDQFEAMVNAMTDQSDTLRVQAEEILDNCRDGFESANEKIRSVNAELLSAAREETAEAVEFVNELARAKSLADAFELQQNYWTNLFEARMKRARDLSEASIEAARASFEPFSQSVKTLPATGFEKFFPFAAK